MTMYALFILGLLSCNVTSYIKSNPNRKPVVNNFAGNNDPSNMKERVISPDEIASLFGSEFSYNEDTEDAVEIDESNISPPIVEEDELYSPSDSPSIAALTYSAFADSITLDNEMYIDENMGYMNMNRALDKVQIHTLRIYLFCLIQFINYFLFIKFIRKQD